MALGGCSTLRVMVGPPSPRRLPTWAPQVEHVLSSRPSTREQACALLRRPAGTRLSLFRTPNTPIAPAHETVTLQRVSPSSAPVSRSRASRHTDVAGARGSQLPAHEAGSGLTRWRSAHSPVQSSMESGACGTDPSDISTLL